MPKQRVMLLPRCPKRHLGPIPIIQAIVPIHYHISQLTIRDEPVPNPITTVQHFLPTIAEISDKCGGNQGLFTFSFQYYHRPGYKLRRQHDKKISPDRRAAVNQSLLIDISNVRTFSIPCNYSRIFFQFFFPG